ncbi:NAD-dependent epimerase/dehydratase family protein, partial [Patescibacteria group bacterium]|nr:NAD-dependent epimerase/dehydratase family protein [Patescibacteria group bacterium]
MKITNLKKEKIMVAGGTGFVGQRVVRRLREIDCPYTMTAKSLGVDFRDLHQTEKFFRKNKPSVLINCAAFVGGIKFGMEHEGEIFYNNSLINLNLFECARKFKIKRIINPISNCSYPDVAKKSL